MHADETQRRKGPINDALRFLAKQGSGQKQHRASESGGWARGRGSNDQPITMSIDGKVIRRDSASSRDYAPDRGPRFIVLFFSAIRADTDTHLCTLFAPRLDRVRHRVSGGTIQSHGNSDHRTFLTLLLSGCSLPPIKKNPGKQVGKKADSFGCVQCT